MSLNVLCVVVMFVGPQDGVMMSRSMLKGHWFFISLLGAQRIGIQGSSCARLGQGSRLVGWDSV